LLWIVAPVKLTGLVPVSCPVSVLVKSDPPTIVWQTWLAVAESGVSAGPPLLLLLLTAMTMTMMIRTPMAMAVSMTLPL
jgi:hypothetical protein